MISPWLKVGALLFFSALVVLGMDLFGHGGVAKSSQFRVLGELLRGIHGSGARVRTILSLAALPLAACLLFAGVSSGDRERARRCTTQCSAKGYEHARIGANSNRNPKDRTTWFVACICEGGPSERLEVNVNAL